MPVAEYPASNISESLVEDYHIGRLRLCRFHGESPARRLVCRDGLISPVRYHEVGKLLPHKNGFSFSVLINISSWAELPGSSIRIHGDFETLRQHAHNGKAGFSVVFVELDALFHREELLAL